MKSSTILGEWLQASRMLAGKIMIMSDAEEAHAPTVFNSEGDGRAGREGAGKETIETEKSGDSEGRRENPLGQIAGVYFIVTADQRFVKIGYSTTIPRRLSQIRTIGPGTANAQLIGYLPGTLQTESWLHRRFAAHRDSGEWFRYVSELKKFAAGLISLPGFDCGEQAIEPIEPEKSERPKLTRRRVTRSCMKSAEEWAESVRKAGKAGGLARAKNLTPAQRRASALKASRAAAKARSKMSAAQRSELASKAAKARWGKKK